MKITIFPQKSDVLAVIQAKIDRETENQKSDQAKLDAVKESKIIRPGQDVALQHLVDQRKEFLAQMEAKKKLLESDIGGTVETEIDL